MSLSPDLRDALADIGARDDADVDLADCALLLAGLERPGVAAAPYRRHLTILARDTGNFAGAAESPEDRAEALRQIVAKRYGYLDAIDGQRTEEPGFGGGGPGADLANTLGDGDSADLTRVIDRRRGLSALLAIIYADVAQRLGWRAALVDFPVRYLLRLDGRGRRVLVDPAGAGRRLSAPDLRALLKAGGGGAAELRFQDWAPARHRDVLLRLLNLGKLRLLRANDVAGALDRIEAMTLIAPGEATPWREAGLLHARRDDLPRAVDSLERYLALTTADGARYRTTVLLRDLRARMEGS
ncbi:MAG: tetratricopeptide repeat protein [Rhodobacterales bacterium]|nr:tetratricopeptide repeat protein [Rhodobacterales bacterium]